MIPAVRRSMEIIMTAAAVDLRIVVEYVKQLYRFIKCVDRNGLNHAGGPIPIKETASPYLFIKDILIY